MLSQLEGITKNNSHVPNTKRLVGPPTCASVTSIKVIIEVTFTSLISSKSRKKFFKFYKQAEIPNRNVYVIQSILCSWGHTRLQWLFTTWCVIVYEGN